MSQSPLRRGIALTNQLVRSLEKDRSLNPLYVGASPSPIPGVSCHEGSRSLNPLYVGASPSHHKKFCW